MRLIGVNCIEEAGISIVGQDAIIESYDKALKWLVSAYGQAIYEFETGQYETGTEQIEALRGRILDVYTFFSELRGWKKSTPGERDDEGDRGMGDNLLNRDKQVDG